MRKKRTKHPKLPNGFGTIRNLGGNRRKPCQALGPATYDKEGKEKRPIIGYAEDWYGAFDLIKEYHNNPYNLDFKNITFEDVFENLKDIWFENIGKPGMSKSNYNNLINAYTNSSTLYKRKMLELKNKDFQKVIDDSNLGYTSKGYLKNLFGRIIKYCKVELEMPLKIQNTEDLDIGQKEKSVLHQPFTLDEIKRFWDIVDNNLITNSVTLLIVKLILISFYTGLRPKELSTLETEKILLDENYMIGGCKTDAGKDRIIPIHPCIKPFIEEMYSPSNKYLVMLESTGKVMSADYYKKNATKLLKKLNMNHTPYDTRHTFATRLEELKIDMHIIKILMGHSLGGDVTNAVYIHRSKERLIDTIKQLYYIEKEVK